MKTKKNDCPVPSGKLFIIGGAENKSEIQEEVDTNKTVLGEFISICKKSPVIEVITTAGTEDVEDTFYTYARCFTDLGAKSVNQIHHDSRPADDAELLQRIDAADAIFFSGGDQLKLTATYGGTAFITAIKERYIHNQLVIGGTSAGAMAMSTPMIFEGSGQREMIAAAVKVTTGFEFLKDVCIDTHFVHRGRFVRMAQVIATNPASIGIGIEEDTAVLITEGLNARIIGSGVVLVIDGENSYGSNIVNYNADKKITIRNLNVSVLSNGEEFVIPCRNPPHI